jgi:hypothetical protein
MPVPFALIVKIRALLSLRVKASFAPDGDHATAGIPSATVRFAWPAVSELTMVGA